MYMALFKNQKAFQSTFDSSHQSQLEFDLFIKGEYSLPPPIAQGLIQLQNHFVI